jgi:hypothetical protein
MTYVSQVQVASSDLAWPAIPEGMNGVQIVAIARMVERVCGTAAAASYLAEAVAAFDKKARSVHANYIAKYDGPTTTAARRMPEANAAATSPQPRAARS